MCHDVGGMRNEKKRGTCSCYHSFVPLAANTENPRYLIEMMRDIRWPGVEVKFILPLRHS